MAALRALALKIALFGSIPMCFAMTPVAAEQVQIGIAATVVGDVRRSNATIVKQVKIPRRERLAWGDTLSTKGNSKLQILLLDRSSLTIGSNSRLTIDRFVYDPGKSRSAAVTVSKGAFRFMSGRKTNNSSASVKSSVGTIGIRGTALDGIVGKEAVEIAKREPFLDGVKSDKKTATLVVLRGPSTNRRGDLDVGVADISAAGKTVTLDRPILAAYIPREGAQPIGPFPLSSRGLSDLQDRLAPIVTNANKSGLLGKLLPATVIGIGLGVLLSDDKNCDTPNSAGQGC